jgi:hypothetical protein
MQENSIFVDVWWDVGWPAFLPQQYRFFKKVLRILRLSCDSIPFLKKGLPELLNHKVTVPMCAGDRRSRVDYRRSVSHLGQRF